MAWTGNFSDFDFVSQRDQFQNRGNNNNKANFQHVSKPAQKFQGGPSIASCGSLTKLSDINPGSQNQTVVGVVLSKEAPRTIQSKKNPGSECHLFSFVLCDAPYCFVNITCWGQELFINDTARTMHIGDIVQISNAQVQSKTQNEYEEKYKPTTPVGYNLSMSENHSSISRYSGSDVDHYKQLIHIPTKPSNDFYTLEDVNANGQNLHGEHINLVVVLKKMGLPKDITTRTGKQTRRCEFKVFDETCQSFPVVLWDSYSIDIALTWIPMETVLFIADVKISFDNFRSSMIATADSKTIFTVNPDTLEAHSLYQYAHSQEFEEEEEDFKTEKNLDDIHDMYTVSQIKCKKEELVACQKKHNVYGYVYAFLTHFNIDDEENKVFRYKCKSCQQIVTEKTSYICNNPECTQGALNLFDPMANAAQHSVEYSIMISLSDHTGTIETCRLDGATTEKLVGLMAEEFQKAGIEMKTTLKWNFLLEKCKVYFKLSCGTTDNKVFMKILSCTKEQGL